jgi:hypothetical protein
VSSALADHGDLLSELTFHLRYLRARSIITYRYLNLDEQTKDQVPIHFLRRLGTSITDRWEAQDTSLSNQAYISPPRNRVQLIYKHKPFVTKIQSTVHNDLYSTAIQATICKQEAWSTELFHQVDWAAHEYAFQQAWTLSTLLTPNLCTNY